MSDQSGPAAHDDSRHLPDQLNLRHSKLEAKRRLAAGEFTTLHDAQPAVARGHGMSSWAMLKEHITAAEAAQGHALAHLQPLHRAHRPPGADEPRWTAGAPDPGTARHPARLVQLRASSPEGTRGEHAGQVDEVPPLVNELKSSPLARFLGLRDFGWRGVGGRVRFEPNSTMSTAATIRIVHGLSNRSPNMSVLLTGVGAQASSVGAG
jgi:hypothetical protein